MKYSKAHFIGIAGKGMSATALLLRQMGVRISGSDEGFYPPVSDYLKNENIPFAAGYRKENIPDDAEIIVIGKNAKLTPEVVKNKRTDLKGAFRELAIGRAELAHHVVDPARVTYSRSLSDSSR